MENLQSKAIKSVFWVGGIKFLSQAISWSVTILLIRILAPEDYGLMGIALAYRGFVAVFFDLCVGEAVLQKKEIDDIDTSTAFWISSMVTVVLYALSWHFAVSWANFFENDALVDIIRVTGLTLFFMSIKEIPNQLMARNFEFKRRSQCELIAAVLSLIVSLVLALNGYGVWALVIGELARYAVLSLLIAYFAKWLPKFVFSYARAKQLLKYGFPVTGHYLLEFVSSKSDSLIIGKMLGQSVLGYYTVAMSISRIPVSKGVQIIQQVMFPLFSALQNDIEEFQRYFYQVIYVVSVVFFPVFFGMLAISEEIVIVVLSEKWLPSLFAFRVFTVLGLLLSYSGILMVILKARANTRALFKYSTYSAILFPAGFYLASHFGLDGIVLSWLVIYPIIFSYLFYEVAKESEIGVAESLSKVSDALIGSLVMIIVIFASKYLVFGGEVSVNSMVFGVAVGSVTYVTYFLMFSRKTFREAKIIWQNLRS